MLIYPYKRENSHEFSLSEIDIGQYPGFEMPDKEWREWLDFQEQVQSWQDFIANQVYAERLTTES